MGAQPKSRAEKHKEAALGPEAAENEVRWEERLRKIAKHARSEPTPVRDPVVKKWKPEP